MVKGQRKVKQEGKQVTARQRKIHRPPKPPERGSMTSELVKNVSLAPDTPRHPHPLPRAVTPSPFPPVPPRLHHCNVPVTEEDKEEEEQKELDE